MPRSTQHPKHESFNFRVDPDLKIAFQTAAEAEDKPAAQLLRDFMRIYVERQNRQTFVSEAQRQSKLLATAAENRDSDEAEVMRWIDNVSETTGWRA